LFGIHREPVFGSKIVKFANWVYGINFLILLVSTLKPPQVMTEKESDSRNESDSKDDKSKNANSKSKKTVDEVISDAKETAKEAAKKIKEEAKDIAKDLDEGTKDFQEEAKSVASDFTKGAKDAYEQLSSEGQNKRILAGVLAIFFGALGIHKFVLGYYKEGVIMLVVSLLSFGFLAGLMALIGLIEGILYLTKSDAEFYSIYQVNQRPWF
jgi:TM2 domain-containing membrane protein YozV